MGRFIKTSHSRVERPATGRPPRTPQPLAALVGVWMRRSSRMTRDNSTHSCPWQIKESPRIPRHQAETHQRDLLREPARTYGGADDQTGNRLVLSIYFQSRGIPLTNGTGVNSTSAARMEVSMGKTGRRSGRTRYPCSTKASRSSMRPGSWETDARSHTRPATLARSCLCDRNGAHYLSCGCRAIRRDPDASPSR